MAEHSKKAAAAGPPKQFRKVTASHLRTARNLLAAHGYDVVPRKVRRLGSGKQSPAVGEAAAATDDRPARYDWAKGVPGRYEGVLSREIETYARLLDQLLPHEGEYVVISGDEVRRFPTRPLAVDYASQRFGNDPVLIKEIRRFEAVVDMGGISY